MKRLIQLVMTLCLIGAPSWSWSLPTEIEADRLLMLIKAARDAKDHVSEVENMEALASLNVALPESYYFHFGNALVNTHSYRRAKTMYEKYLTVAGKNGKYYGDALAALNRTIELIAKTPDKDCDACPEMQALPKSQLAVSKYAITFDEWDACVAGGGCNGYIPKDEGWGRGRRPVINVSWQDAKAYTAWLSKKTGATYRLLTDNEWEYAARAGSTSLFYWGDQLGKNNANCDGCGSTWDNRSTAPVGSFAPNAFGLYDMLGNVWQWVEDTAGPDGDQHAMRGGSFYGPPITVRVSSRFTNAPGERAMNYGLRVAKAL